MKSRSKNLFPLFLIFLASAFLIGIAALWLAMWLGNRTPTSAELLQPLTASQRQCVEQIVNGHTLIYVSQQSPENKLVLGYTEDKELYVAVVNEEPDNVCHTEFNEKVFDCYQSYLPEYCTDSRLRLQKVEAVELTGDTPAEMYVWFDVLGVGRRNSAKHQFYVEQSDSSFRMVLELRLCVDLGSLEINKDLRKIIATDDMGCFMFFQGKKEYIEYTLLNGTPQKLRDDFDPI
jgi:hypothetical protein